MLALIVTAVIGVVFRCIGLAAVTGANGICGAIIGAPGGDIGAYDAEQRGNAALIADIGARRNIPVQARIIAVAVTIQESGLRNLGDLGPRNDHDSLGLFQQRPSQGWGAPQQLLDPAYAAGAPTAPARSRPSPRYDTHDKVHTPLLPLLFQRRRGSTDQALGQHTVLQTPQRCCAALARHAPGVRPVPVHTARLPAAVRRRSG
ncbi:hypothetical protein ACPPVO_35150 [Dactylosporangium sp. McL0621]|uniref:hypothetical protein n=1 Tax=Dactylosporangium sp. McL0621 TaxID=3415678 RepID=UPI003CE7445D